MKRLRWPLLVLILIAAALALAPLVPLGSLKPKVEARLSELFNRQVEIGSMRLSLLGGPYFTLRRVAVSMSPEFGDGNLLEAEKVSANLAVLPLLSGDVQIEALEFDSPRVSLVRNPGGVWNWTTVGRPTASVRTQFPRLFTIATISLTSVAVIGSLEEFEARNASVRVIDRAEAGLPERLYRNVNLTAFIQPAPGNLGPDARRISGVLSARSGVERGARLNLNAPFDLTFIRPNPTLAFSGRIGPAEVETDNFAARDLTSSVSLRDRQLAFDQIEMKLYDGAMRGRATFDLADDRFTAAGALDHLNLNDALTGKLKMPGEIKGHINAEFDLSGKTGDLQQAFPSCRGDGRVSSGQLFMPGFNVSEQFARALRIGEIGEMGAGTEMAGVAGRFRLEDGLLRTEDLIIERFDGIGQARVEHGWIRFGGEPVINYTAAVTLSPETTERVKSASLLLGAITTWLEKGNRLTIPVSVTGGVRDPKVRVDARRMF